MNMNSVSSVNPIQTIHNDFSKASISKTPSLGMRIFAIASTLLLMSNGGYATSRDFNMKKLEGGAEVALPDFNALTPLVTQYGPYYSPELICQLMNPIYEDEICTSSIDTYAHLTAESLPATISPYINTVKHLTPKRNQPVRKFPKNLEAFVFNEIGLVGNGNRGCVLKNGLQIYSDCQKLVNKYLEVISEQETEENIYTDRAFRNTGTALWLENAAKMTVRVGINPNVMQNYREGMDEVSKTMLQNDCFFQRSPEKIIEFIKQLHMTVMSGLPANEPMNDEKQTYGAYRTEGSIVFKDPNKGRSVEEMVDTLTELGATSHEVLLFVNSVNKLINKMPLWRPELLTSKELKVWEKLAYFPPNAKQIPKMMVAFATNLKKFVQQDLHPVALAAWAHCELGRIQPFGDGNGRIARLLMHAILIRGGYEPIVITDDAAYTEAITKDSKNPGAFAKYLAGLINQQAKGPQVLIRA